MMSHNDQLVCTACFYKRKPVELKYRPKRKWKRKLLLWGLIIAAVAAAAWAVWHFAF